MTDGSKYKTRSTLGKEGHHLKLDIDPKTHPADWTTSNSELWWTVARFNKKFGKLESNFSFLF